MEDCVYDTTGERRYYKEFVGKQILQSTVAWAVAGLMMMLAAVIPIIFLGMGVIMKTLPFMLLTVFGGGFAFYVSISFFRREQEILRNEKVGVRVDNRALEFFGSGPKRFELSEIDSVIIGEDVRCWGCGGKMILVKTADQSSDGRGVKTYSWDIGFVMDAEKFGDCLASHGVDVFYKRNGHYHMHKSELSTDRKQYSEAEKSR